MIVLFMTLGIGRPAPENLAHGLAFCIKESRAENVVIFGSERSREMLPSIEASYAEQAHRKIPEYRFLELSRIDDIHHSFTEILAEYNKIVKDTPAADIIINNNSGTKSMTSAMTFLSLLTRRTIFFVEGERDPSGAIIIGTERILQQTLYPVYDEMILQHAIQYFNHRQYSYAIHELSGVCRHPRKEPLRELFSAYDLWDRFNHREAYELFKTLPVPEGRSIRFEKNRAFLNKLLNSPVKEERYICVLVDLISNAQRRFDEGRYDDAVARMYRAFELCAQVMFLEIGLDDIEKKIPFTELERRIPDRDRLNRYNDYRNGSNVLVGCRRKYQLLQDLGETDAMKWLNEMQSLLDKRNASIYAHGITPVKRETAELFLKKMNDFITTRFGGPQKKNGTSLEELFAGSQFIEIDG